MPFWCQLILSQANVAAETTFTWILRSEGWFFWVQTPAATLMLTLVLSAFDLTRRRLVMPPLLMADIAAAMKDPARASTALQHSVMNSRSPLAQTLQAGVAAYLDRKPLNDVETAVGDACESLTLSMERRISWITSLAHVAMSTGLLGTVWGLVLSFTVIATSGEAPRADELAGGVSMALVTTIFGLLTAIPGLFAVGVLRPLNNRRMFELERYTLAVVRELFVPAVRVTS